MTFFREKQRFVWIITILAVGMNAVHGVEIEPPKSEIVDKFGVNMATGQVTHGLTTVSIGGPMGLSHRISIYANELYYKNSRGFSDNMRYIAHSVRLSTDPNDSVRMVYNVGDGSDSASFTVEQNGVRVEDFVNTQPPYAYAAVGDTRHSLVVNGDLLEWTKPDGTLVKFQRIPNAPARQEGRLLEIVHPTGFIIRFTDGMAIQSNTGYMLKSIYGSDTRPMEKTDNRNLVGVHPATTSQASGWSIHNPVQVKAINTAVEFCQPEALTCDTVNAWPTAKFDWPPGMPRTMYIGDSTVSITDAAGGITKYRYRAHDLALNESGTVNGCCVAGREFSPRLVGVTPAGSSSERFTYRYKTIFVFNDSIFGTWNYRAKSSGVVTWATDISKTSGYGILDPYYETSLQNRSSGGGISNVYLASNVPGNPDAIERAVFDDGTIHFEISARNFPTQFFKHASLGFPEKYEYDSRGNLSKVSRGPGGNYVMHREAKYADNCTSANRKHCNQAEWVKDAKGKITSYQYHAPSGQVASVTYPPNQNSISAQTRYEYTQLSARYFDGSGGKITGTPIWMKTAEKYCINSSFAGSCAGNDEVVTRYEYNHDNLQMTGMTVTDPTTGTTLRTCFQYDRNGNQIGKTAPKAGLTSCPQP
jgi:hypothetical protein